MLLGFTLALTSPSLAAAAEEELPSTADTTEATADTTEITADREGS